jgi:uncharacterized protein YndB with AHSA1/START domain
MKSEEIEESTRGVELEYDLNAPPQKVWQAISVPELRESWLPGDALVDGAATTVTPGQEVRYTMREDNAPFLESTVTFSIAPNGNGGTILRIIHEIDRTRLERMTKAAANSNTLMRMRAA